MPTRLRIVALLLCILLVYALIFHSHTSAAVTFVRLVESDVVASSISVSSGSFSASVTNGDLIVVRVFYNSASRSVSSITDSKSNIYARAVGPTTGTGAMAGYRQEIWYARNVTGGSGLNVTATFDASFNAEKSISAHEYSGFDAAAPLDVTAAQTSSVANASSGAVTTTSPVELIFGAALFSGCGSPGSGFSGRSSLGCNVTEDRSVTTSGSYAAAFANSSQSVIAQMATFRAAGQIQDTTPPSVPTGLAATVVSQSQINLSWLASTDNVGVTGYQIFRDGVQTATSTGTSFSNSGLLSSTSYAYAVRALDAAGNLSGLSTSVSATTAPGTPSAPTPADGATSISRTPTLTWTAAGATSYDVNFGTSTPPPSVSTGQSTATYIPAMLAAGTTYYWQVIAHNSGGTSTGPVWSFTTGSKTTPTITWSTPASIVYGTPLSGTQLNATASVPGTFAYTPAAGTVLSTGAGQTLSATFTPTDAANYATATASVFITVTQPLSDTTPPSVPANLTATAESSSTITLTWSASTDNVGVAGYRVYRGTTPVGTTAGTTYSDTGLTASTLYSYAVAAYDAAGNTSASSASAAALTQSAGSVISYWTNFPLTENPISESGNWTNGKTAGLDWRDIRTTPGLAFGTQDGSTNYTDSIAVLEGTWGADQTATATVHTVNQQSGSVFEEVELLLRFSITANSATGYELNYSCRSDGSQYVQIIRWNGAVGSWTLLDSRSGPGLQEGDEVKATIAGSTITIYINDVAIFSVTDTTYASGSPGIGFYLQGGTAALAGDYGFTSFAATSNVPADTQSPSVPAGLSAAAVSQTQVNLSWQPSTDNVATTGYQILRNGVQVATSASTAFSDTGLAAATTYSYAVVAVDAAGNISAPSSGVSATTLAPPDTTPPSVPANLTASAQSSAAITLTWSASTDNVAVVGYRIYRDGTQVGTTASTAYSDTALAASTSYTYQIAAYDAANNASTTSTAVSATTPGLGTSGIVGASSCSQADVQNAINAAPDGYVVVVPSGTCTWTTPAPHNAAISIYQKAVTLQGAGIDQTVINTPTGTESGEVGIRIDSIEGKQVRLTGFTFSGGSELVEIIAVDTAGGISKDFRIDHTMFTAQGFATAVHVTGATYGLLDHNTFQNTRVFVDDDGDGSWQRPLNLGGADAVYVEDNTFDFDVSASTISGRNGARYVFRYNTTNVGLASESTCSSGLRGARRVEIYGNALAATGAGGYLPDVPIALRSGTGVIFDNFASGPFGRPVILIDDERSDANSCAGIWAAHPTCDGAGPYDGNTPGMSGYLCRDQLGASTDAGLAGPQTTEALYAWNNQSSVNGGSVDIIPGGGTGTALHVQENRDFFNTAKPGYAPYPYPHPLAAAPALDTEVPVVAITSPFSQAIVSGSVTVSAIAWDNVAVAAVAFLVDGVTLGSPRNAPPYTIAWDSGVVAPGAHTLTAVASDTAGNNSVSTPIVVYTIDTTPPVVTMTLPVDGATVSGASVTVSAAASDNVGLAGVQFLLDGFTLGAEATVAPYSIAWNTTQTTSGLHTLTAFARDAAGNVSTSAPVSVTVVSGAPVSYYPWTYNVGTGTYQSGDAASLTANDSNYFVVRSTTSGATRQSMTDFGFANVTRGSRLDYSVRLKSSTSSATVVLFAFNYALSTWTQLGSLSIGTGEATLSASIATSASDYVSVDGQMSVRVQSSKARTSHSIYDDLITVVVTP